MKRKVVVAVNTGSSSVKCAAFIYEGGCFEEWYRFSAHGVSAKDIQVVEQGDFSRVRRISGNTGISSALDEIMNFLKEKNILSDVTCIGHRMVHGGTYTSPLFVHPDIINELEQFVSLAPMHNPAAMACIRNLRGRLPNVPQVICFDTHFHTSIPAISSCVPIAPGYTNGFIKKYGFHGLSCESVLKQFHQTEPELASGKIVIAHLGNGCSLTAVQGGRSVDNTMGFTPLGGIVMSERSGDLDPGILLYLMKERRMTMDEIMELLYDHSGLKALHGETGNLSELVEMADDEKAGFVVDYFVRKVCAGIASLAAGMGGMNALIFTGGIGENNVIVRKRIVDRMEWMGLKLQDENNSLNRSVISWEAAAVYIGVIHTNEERMIAEHAMHLINASETNYRDEK